MIRISWRIGLVIGLAVVAVLIAFLLPPIRQDVAYHHFADNRTIFGIPNFCNVLSNVTFLFVALWGLARSGRFVEPWECTAHIALLGGTGLVAFGSGFYHFHPSDANLFWDRLPMTVVFMALLSITIGERVNAQAGRRLFIPLLAIGATSLLVWKITGDLRMYGLVQFYPMLALPLVLIFFPPRYTGTAGVWAMIGLYAIAKVLEFSDQWVWRIAAPLSGHPLKHIAGAVAMLCYVETIRRREILTESSLAHSVTAEAHSDSINDF